MAFEEGLGAKRYHGISTLHVGVETSSGVVAHGNLQHYKTFHSFVAFPPGPED